KKTPIVECIEIVNTKIFDKKSFHFLADKIHVKLFQGKEEIELQELYYKKYHLKNLSNQPVPELLIELRNHNNLILSTISQGRDMQIPDWTEKLFKLMEDESDEKQKDHYFLKIPYLNPYTSKHEAFIELYSYKPMTNVELYSGAKGVNFVLKKYRNQH
ncbi:MAG: hypothetical protein GWP06_09125, partial [Actinobacteria bacterium]|nr:hypothetical protein [Actinomycetota bacterium]